jgi:hypothetical protein
MTGDAFVHVPGFVRQSVVFLNLAVALLAGQVLVDMPLMVEQNVFGYIVHFCPGSRLLRVEIFVLLLDPGMLFNNVVVAVQTLFHRRHPRKIGVGHVWVAILALNLFDAAVDVVAERYGLFRTNPGRWRSVKQNKKCADKDHTGERDENND